MRKVRMAVLGCVAFLCTSSMVFANSITWSFTPASVSSGTVGSTTSAGTVYGSTMVFNSIPSSGPGAGTITATGYFCGSTSVACSSTSTTSAAALFYKTGGTNETGLGLNGQTDNEIDQFDYIALDFSNVIGDKPITVTLFSVQTGEGYVAAEQAAGKAGVFGTLDSTSCVVTTSTPCADTVTFTVTKADPIIDISAANTTAGGHNVLIGSASANSPAPEPGSLLLFGTGLSGLAVTLRRRVLKQ